MIHFCKISGAQQTLRKELKNSGSNTAYQNLRHNESSPKKDMYSS